MLRAVKRCLVLRLQLADQEKSADSMFHGREYSRLWLKFDVDRTGFIGVDQVDPVIKVRVAVPVIALRVPVIALRYR